MKISCNNEQIQKRHRSLVKTLEQAAKLCLKEENISGDRIEIGLSFASMEEIYWLNRVYRQVNCFTDVLSFPMVKDFSEIDGDRETLLGDVVICLEKARQQAEKYGHSEMREIVYLFVHSVLHLLGYDHMEEADKLEMRRQEEIVMDALGLKRDM